MSKTGNRSTPGETRSEGGKSGETHRETREHNKHNDPGQSGHKPQKHSPAEEKR